MRLSLQQSGQDDSKTGILSRYLQQITCLLPSLGAGVDDENEMKASSKQVMAGIRWVLDFCTLLLLAALVVIGWINNGALAEGLSDIGGDQMVLKPALWLGSLYLLIFLSETWLRLKENSHR